MLIVGFFVVDAVALWWVFAKHRIQALGGMTFGEFQKFTAATGGMIRDHMRTNYSGRPEQLPEVLPGLLSKVRSRVMEKGMRLERPVLKTVVTRMITMNKLAEQQYVEEAMEKVA
jgi:hypothetical protein